MGNEQQPSIGKNSEYMDFFILGASGSGKDTVADFLKSYYNMRKMRLAGTIKQVICETYDLTFEELEEQKRADPNIRLKHHEVSTLLGGQKSSLNRTFQIARHESFDLNIVDDPERPIVVCDCRTFEEANVMLSENFVGIFLSRQSGEFKDPNHFTETNLFENGKLIELSETLDFAENMIVVFNDKSDTKESIAEFTQKLNSNVTICTPLKNCNGIELVEAIDAHLNKWLK